jgi:hypothetical protein
MYPVTTHMNPDHIVTLYFCKIRFNIIIAQDDVFPMRVAYMPGPERPS